MRFLVFESSTPLDAPADHNCSRSRANLAVSMKLARRIGQNAIQLIEHTWREVKQRMSGIFTAPKPSWCREGYEHHIEPKLEKLTIGDSPWLSYLHGWDMVTA